MWAICTRIGPRGSLHMRPRIFDDMEKAEAWGKSLHKQLEIETRERVDIWLIFFDDPRQ